MNKGLTQSQQVLKYINDFGSITSLQAFIDLGVIQLPRRIYDLRKSGINVSSEIITVKNRYGEETRINRYFISKGI